MDAEKLVAEEYSKTDLMLNNFREDFPHIMSAREYAEELPGEDLEIQQLPSAKEFVDHILQAEPSSEEESEEEKELVSDEAYDAAFSVVEKYVHQKALSLGPKHVGNVFLLKQAVQRQRIETELAAKTGQSSIRSFFYCTNVLIAFIIPIQVCVHK